MLQKLFGIKGNSPVRQLAGEVMPTLQLFNGRENRYLEGWAIYGARAVQGAVAAQDSVIRLINPLGSNIIAVIESIIVSTSIADEIAIENTVVPTAVSNLASTFTAVGFDTRFQPSGTGTGGAACQISAAPNIGQGARVIWADLLTQALIDHVDIIEYDEQQTLLLPGTDMQIRELNLNSSLRASIRWRERQLEVEETR